LRELWKKLKVNAKVEKRKRAIVVNVLDVGRIFQARAAFKKWRRFTVNVRELSRMDSLVGCQI
jgi:hypothetical protein